MDALSQAVGGEGRLLRPRAVSTSAMRVATCADCRKIVVSSVDHVAGASCDMGVPALNRFARSVARSYSTEDVGAEIFDGTPGSYTHFCSWRSSSTSGVIAVRRNARKFSWSIQRYENVRK